MTASRPIPDMLRDIAGAGHEVEVGVGHAGRDAVDDPAHSARHHLGVECPELASGLAAPEALHERHE